LAASRIRGFLKTSHAYQLRRQTIAHYSWQSIFRRQILPLIEEVMV
jgi:hypothetical protein